MANILSIRTGLCVLWLSIVGAGIGFELVYQTRGGQVGATPEQWPAGTPVTLDAKRDTLLLFAHPHCPCSRASLEELNRLLARCDGRVAAHVLFLKPEQFSDDWTRSDLRRSAEAIPGVMVQDDVDGNLARQFGAETSGYVLLYDTHGQLLFKGGITGSRGHAGDNTGEGAIIALVTGKNPGVKQTSVYGCPLLDKSCSQEVVAK